MSGGKLTDHQKVLDWSTNFKTNRTPFTTDSAAISLKELEEFINEAKVKCPDFAALRIYLVRYPLSAQKAELVKDRIKSDVNNLSQPSLVLIPMRSFDPAKGTGDDFKVGSSNDVYALAIADPESSDPGEASVLCPPKCG
jgi:hypothetical protein